MHELFHCFGICGEPHPSVLTIIMGGVDVNIYVKHCYDKLKIELSLFVNSLNRIL